VGLPAQAAEYSQKAATQLNGIAVKHLREKRLKEGQDCVERGLALLKGNDCSESKEGGILFTAYSELSQAGGDLQAAKLYQTEAALIFKKVNG
jgi:hypothetical protein